MNEPVLVAVLTLAGVLLTVLGGYFGVRATTKVSDKAQKSQSEIEKSKVDAAAYASAREIWGSLIDDLRDQIAGQRDELRLLRQRIDCLEQNRHTDRQDLQKRDDYISVLRRLLRKAAIEHPDPPAGFADHN